MDLILSHYMSWWLVNVYLRWWFWFDQPFPLKIIPRSNWVRQIAKCFDNYDQGKFWLWWVRWWRCRDWKGSELHVVCIGQEPCLNTDQQQGGGAQTFTRGKRLIMMTTCQIRRGTNFFETKMKEILTKENICWSSTKTHTQTHSFAASAAM